MMRQEITPKDIFGFLCRWYGVDWEAVMAAQSFSGTLRDHHVQGGLFEMYRFIQADDDALAWQKGMDILSDILSRVDLERLESGVDFDRVIELLSRIKDWRAQYSVIRERHAAQWQEWLSHNIIPLSEEERQDASLGTKCPRTVLAEVDDMVNRYKLFKLFRYKGNGSIDPGLVERTVFCPTFILSDNVAGYIPQLQDGAADELKVYAFFQIDRPVENSYFYLVLNIGDNWFIATDEAQYANPYAKQGVAQRGAYRFREHTFDYSVMPYRFIDRLAELRAAAGAVAKDGEGLQQERYILPLTEWTAVERILLNLVVNSLFKQLVEQADGGQLPQGRFGFEHMQANRLLEGQTVEVDRAESSAAFKSVKAMDAVIANLMYGTVRSSAVVKADASAVGSMLQPLSSSVMTAERWQQQVAWAVHQAEYSLRSQQLAKLAEYRDNDWRELWALVDSNIAERFADLFCAEKVYICVYDRHAEYSSDKELTYMDGKQKLVLSKVEGGGFSYISRPVGGVEGGTCAGCDKNRLLKSHISMVKVIHYAALAWLAGVSREQLSDYFKNYMADIYWPYYGNTLLDNINPLYRLKDDCSSQYSSVRFNVSLCKRCRTRFAKAGGMKEAVIVIDAETCRKIEVLEKDDFKQKYIPDGPLVIM